MGICSDSFDQFGRSHHNEKRQKDYDGYIRLFEELLLAVTILFVVVSIAMMLLGKIAVLILYGKNI